MGSRNKSVISQWIVPSVIVTITVMAMLFNFLHKNTERANETVTKELIVAVEGYGERYRNELLNLQIAARPVCLMLAEEETDDSEYVARALKAVIENLMAYQIYYCDESGAGIDQDGGEISVADTGYFSEILKSDGVSYIYADEADGLNQDTIIVAVRVPRADETKYMLIYHSLIDFCNLVGNYDYEPDPILALIDSEGKILVTDEPESEFVQSGNLLDVLQSVNSEGAKALKARIVSGTKGSTVAVVGEETRTFVYVPFKINGWEIVLGVHNDYMDKEVKYQCANARNMARQLCIVILAFIAFVMVYIVISRIRSNENKKQLENKADTDLLTGLNNKLATERKIKEYMSGHPDTQSMMLLLDIDNFKKINDTMGHAFGDEVLRSLGQQIGANFRASDIIGRVGGDEFMVFLKGIESKETIRKEAKKVETFFRGFQAGEYVKYAATASIGAAIYPQEGADFETLYKAADQGLYKAKKRGKNQLAFYRDEWEKDENGEPA